jgi:predicted TIM-barrel fold metal-dependent hydrolase
MEYWMCARARGTDIHFVLQHAGNLEREPHHNHAISYRTYKVRKVKEIVLKIQLTFSDSVNRYSPQQYLLMGRISDVTAVPTISFKS